MRLLPVIFISLSAISASVAQDSEKVEEIRDVSPDKKFAMRIVCDSEPEDPDHIDSALITGIELIALPSKKVMAQLLPSGDVDSHFEDVTLIWSLDSRWCAFYYSFPRVGYTSVYHLSGRKFVAANKPEELSINAAKGLKDADVRNEHIRPLRWSKPGVLVLEQYTTFRSAEGPGDITYQFTAAFSEKGRKFRILSKKEIPDTNN